MSTAGPSPALFFDTINAYQRTEALRTAIELELFTHVAAGRRTATELADACKAAPRGVRILADYLTILGFLRKDAEQYELTPDAAVFLTRNSPAYLGGILEFMLTPQIRECFTVLTEAVRRGGTATSDEGTVSHDNPVWVSFARAMGAMMQLPAKLLVDLVDGDRQKPLRILDVAAGHGLFGIAFAQQFLKARITAMDWPNVLAVAAENARKAGMSDRYSLLGGSAFEVDWGGPYDIVLLTNFFHHFDIPTCEALAAKTFAARLPRRPSDDARVRSERGPRQSAARRGLRPGDARLDRSRRRLHVRGIRTDLCQGRVRSKRVSRTPADNPAGSRVVQTLNASGEMQPG